MSLEREYHTLWNWLLDKGLFVAMLIVQVFLATVTALVMVGVYLYLKWLGKH